MSADRIETRKSTYSSHVPLATPRMRLTATHTFVTLGLPMVIFREIASRLRSFGYGHCFYQDEEEGQGIDMSGIALVPDVNEKLEDWHLNADSTVAVSERDHFRPMSSCPRGVKVQLLNLGRFHTSGVWNGEEGMWLGWCPLPFVPDNLC